MTSWFWNEHFWLPENVTWADFRTSTTTRYPQFHELGYSIIVGAIFLVVRLLTETLVFLPIGYAGGWVDTRKKGLFRRMWEHLAFGFCGRGKFKRVAETAFRFTFYLSSWAVGLWILLNQPQFKDINECWRNWPKHNISEDVWWYYISETGFYWSLLLSTFAFDVRRSDYMQMMLHHSVTICLLSMSFTINFVRVGTLILLIHDTADILLELGKLFRYARWSNAVTVVFAIFLCTWIGTRLVYFPFWLLHSMIYEARPLIQENYRWENFLQRPIIPRVFLAMLLMLLVLHVFWTFLLLKIAVKSPKSGVDDIREESDSEALLSEDDGEGEESSSNGSLKRKKKTN